MQLRDRIEGAYRRAGFRSQSELARACDVRPASINQLLTGRFPGPELLKKVAEKTGVSYEWLRFGDRAKAPPWIVGAQPRVSGSAAAEVVAQLTTGAGELDLFEDSNESLEIPSNWKIVVVHSKGAYPIFYPGDFAWVDIGRAATPSTMSDSQYLDLHDRIVVVQIHLQERRIGLIKRFNYQPKNPDRFALSSLDGGRSSPYLPPNAIDVIWPVVGSWWEDPRGTQAPGGKRLARR